MTPSGADSSAPGSPSHIASDRLQRSAAKGPGVGANAKAPADPGRPSAQPVTSLSGAPSASERAALEAAMVRHFWTVGDLRYKLHSDQRAVAKAISDSTYSRYVLEIARRWGK